MKEHNCIAIKNNNWIVFMCPYCNYEMLDNLVTGEKIYRNVKADIRHSGFYSPPEYNINLKLGK